MMRWFVFIFFPCCFWNCSGSSEQEHLSFQDVEQQVDQALTSWHKSAAEADFTSYFSYMDSASIFVGTDASEVWNKTEFMEFSKPYFDKGKAWSFTPLSRNIYMDSASEVIWFDELLETWMGECRGSGVLKKKDTSWLIQHYVLSLTVPNEDMNKVIEVLAAE